jgi:hypothetical protein
VIDDDFLFLLGADVRATRYDDEEGARVSQSLSRPMRDDADLMMALLLSSRKNKNPCVRSRACLVPFAARRASAAPPRLSKIYLDFF